MSSNIEAFLINILAEYKKQREQQQKETWFNFKSWFKRICNDETEFSYLLGEEPKLLNSYKDWFLSSYKKLHIIETSEDFDKVILCLKSFKDRLSHRSTYLVVFATIMAMGTSLYTLLGGSSESLIINFVFGLAVIFERHFLNQYTAIIQELTYILEIAKNEYQSEALGG